MNVNWWELRLLYQGIVPPIIRNEGHLDALAKRHIPADIPYMKYYVALLLEFQIYEALCNAMGHTGQLHTCDIHRSRETGRILGDIMQIGKSRHWKDVMRMLTRGETDRISPDSLMKYFQPLLLWLKVQNRDESVIGWNVRVEDTALFQPLFSEYNKCSYSVLNKSLLLIVVLLNLQQ